MARLRVYATISFSGRASCTGQPPWKDESSSLLDPADPRLARARLCSSSSPAAAPTRPTRSAQRWCTSPSRVCIPASSTSTRCLLRRGAGQPRGMDCSSTCWAGRSTRNLRIRGAPLAGMGHRDRHAGEDRRSMGVCWSLNESVTKRTNNDLLSQKLPVLGALLVSNTQNVDIES